MYNFLKKIPLFAGLKPADLERLCELVTEVQLPSGQVLFTEGSTGDRAYVIKQGQLEILKASGDRNVLLALRQSGEVIGEMALLESAPRFATVRARTDCTLIEIEHHHLDQLLDTSPSAAKAMLYTITARLRSTEMIIRQSEKMAQLGTLTAGIAHELNNPAAAVSRGASQLTQAFSRWQEFNTRISALTQNQPQATSLQALDQRARDFARQPVELGALDRSDREERLEAWLEGQGVPDGWEYAPLLVNLGYEAEQFSRLVQVFQPDEIVWLVRWLEAAYSVYSLLEEISLGASQMSEIIQALKSYAYLDQAPVQQVDIHAGLDNTLVMLRGKLKGGIRVLREYDPDLPGIQGYGSELNQVWTNLIANAIDAVGEQGELILRTRRTDGWVRVEIQDDGPGIPADLQPKLFSPFFTTKPMGKGTGLGLNISYNIVKKHAGEIKVISHPGLTCFEVILPVNFEAAQAETLPGPGIEVTALETLKSILSESQTIAVVGISNRLNSPAHTVPAYIQQAGYRIFPVNPNLVTVLGEKAYPDLAAIPEPIDIVLIFRPSEYVPEITRQAIAMNARVVWMQEGILNEEAAILAREAGLQVVMNTCIRTTHRRLMAA